MGLLTRMIRMCKADMHGVMDEMEDRDLLLKQHIREMALSLDEKKARIDALKTAISNAEKELEVSKKQMAGINRDIDLAIENERDDIARTLIRKLKPIEHYGRHLVSHMDSKSSEKEKLEKCIALHEEQYEKTRLQANARLQLRKSGCQPVADHSMGVFDDPGSLLSDKEVELVLLRKKQALKERVSDTR